MAKARIDVELGGAEAAARKLEKINQAEKRLEQAFDAGRISAEQFVKSTTRLSAAREALMASTRRASMSTQAATQATRQLSLAQNEAKQKAVLLSSQLGLPLPAAMQNLVVKSQALQKGITAAFGISAAAFFASFLVSRVAPAIQSIIDKSVGLTEEVKRAEEAARRLNVELLGGGDSFEGATKRAAALSLEIAGLEKKLEGLRLTGSELPIIGPILDKLQENFAANAFEVENLRQRIEAKKKELERLQDFILSKSPFRLLGEHAKKATQAVSELGISISELQVRGDLGREVLRAQEERLKGLQTVLDLERDLNIQRLEHAGRTEEAILLRVQHRVEETEKLLRQMGLTEDEISRGRVAIEGQAQLEIDRIRQRAADEERRRQEDLIRQQQQRLEDMQRQFVDFFDRILFSGRTFGSTMRDIFEEMKRFFIRQLATMLVRWLLTIKAMRDLWDRILGGLGGSGTNIGINIGIGVGGTPPTFPTGNLLGFQHGGLVDEAIRQHKLITSAQGSILAILHSREAVLNAGATRILGPSRIEALNAAGRGAPSFQSGGLVGAPSAGGPAVQINFAPGSIISAGNPRAVAAEVIREINRRARDQGLPGVV